MNMVLRVGHYTPGVEIILYPSGWQGMLPDLGLEHDDIYKVGCDYFRKRISGEDENITALIDAYVLQHSGESVGDTIARNVEQVTALFQHVETRAHRPATLEEKRAARSLEAETQSDPWAFRRYVADEMERDGEANGYW